MISAIRNTPQIAIVGASGFIGKRLVADLIDLDCYEIRVLSRNKEKDLMDCTFDPGVKIFEGDLGNRESLKIFLVPGCTVINLVYLWAAGKEKNIFCIHNLMAACKDAKISRLIHCSTAAVAGRSPHDLIDEQVHCQPISEYGITKLTIEQDIIEYAKYHFDAVILRPTSVFGVNGDPLKKLAGDLVSGSRIRNYLKSSLFGHRRMNLVSVANVTAAIIFLARYAGDFGGEIFIVSDDDDPKNNFYDVELLLMNALGVSNYALSQIPVPLDMLKLILIILGRNNANPRCNFDPDRLRKLGFNRPICLADGLAEYAAWYRNSHLGETRAKPS